MKAKFGNPCERPGPGTRTLNIRSVGSLAITVAVSVFAIAQILQVTFWPGSISRIAARNWRRAIHRQPCFSGLPLISVRTSPAFESCLRGATARAYAQDCDTVIPASIGRRADNHSQHCALRMRTVEAHHMRHHIVRHRHAEIRHFPGSRIEALLRSFQLSAAAPRVKASLLLSSAAVAAAADNSAQHTAPASNPDFDFDLIRSSESPQPDHGTEELQNERCPPSA